MRYVPVLVWNLDNRHNDFLLVCWLRRVVIVVLETPIAQGFRSSRSKSSCLILCKRATLDTSLYVSCELVVFVLGEAE